MDRVLFLAASSWVSGVGALSVGAGYLIAQAASSRHRNSLPSPAYHITCQELDTPPPSPTSKALSSPLPPDLEEDSFDEKKSDAIELRRPNDASELLTEAQRLRLRPVNPLKRKRRSRKVRETKTNDDKFIPLVPGARTSTAESILNAYTGDTIYEKREAGEDYWVDPALLLSEQERKEQEETRRKQLRLRERPFEEEKLRTEISAPYKNNYIGAIVLGVGAVAFFFYYFPNLLESPVIDGVATFPGEL